MARVLDACEFSGVVRAPTAEEARALDDVRLESWIAGLSRREEELLRELGLVRAGREALCREQWRRHGNKMMEKK